MVRWAGHVARTGDTRNAYSILVGKPEGKRPLRRPRRIWEDIGEKGVVWMQLAQDRDQWWALVKRVMIRVP
jgi:hypothetical protein